MGGGKGKETAGDCPSNRPVNRVFDRAKAGAVRIALHQVDVDLLAVVRMLVLTNLSAPR
jgi:hypothetical protein